MTHDPVRLLVSVRDGAEALLALAGGAEVIDVKDPSRGALGMADTGAISSVIDAVAGRAPVSAALGELADPPRAAPLGLAYVKVGLADAPHDWHEGLCRRFDRALPARPVAVAYADHHRVAAPPVDQVLAWACEHRAQGMLIDTAVKDGHDLFDWIDSDRLVRLIERTRGAGMFMALAGSLAGESLRRATALGPNIIAVRGAACAGDDRRQAIDAQRVAQLSRLIRAHNTAADRRAS